MENNNWEIDLDKHFSLENHCLVWYGDYDIKQFISDLLFSQEAILRKEYKEVIDKLIEDHTFDIQDARKETILEVLPEELIPELPPDYENGFNKCRQSMIYLAEYKFNIKI